MKILGENLLRFEEPGDKSIFASDDYVRNQAIFYSEHGFLPPIDSENPPTIDQMRQTLESRHILNRSIGNSPSAAMVPEGWVDPKNPDETIFRRGEVENGIVIFVDVTRSYSDNREFMKAVAAATMEQRKEDRRTGKEHW